jgi:uncharacterized protein with HEPN domain
MPSKHGDNTFLADMLTAVEEIRQFTESLNEADFCADLVKRRAVERSLEMLAEAQKNVSDQLKARHPEIPWRQLQDLGNFYRHAYFRIEPELVWEAATGSDLALIEKMLHDELPFARTDRDDAERPLDA